MRIAITGGSGSLGRALIRRLIADCSERVVTFSRDEQKRASLAGEFGPVAPAFRAYAGDVRDRERMVSIFRGCEAVIHAAARKVVTAHPDEPEELLKTNVIGTQNVIAAALEADVSKLIIVSSDKAVRAENVYGVSKAMAEHLAVMANARTLPQGLRIGCVRYGNVIGSTGSVVPLWREAIKKGLRVRISDKRMTRFWITMPRAVDLVLFALANLRGGEIVVPNLSAGPVLSLARACYHEAGIDPDPDHYDYFDYVGIRPGGEKLHEELLSESEVWRTHETGYGADRIYVVPPFQNADMWDDRPWPGHSLPHSSVYRSDVWQQASISQLAAMLKEA